MTTDNYDDIMHEVFQDGYEFNSKQRFIPICRVLNKNRSV